MAALLPMNDDENVWIAASDGDLEKVRQYIAQDPRLATAGDDNGYTAIHAAAAYGHQELFQMLLTAGADIHARDNDGDTPLHHCDDPTMAAFMVALGAAPTVANNDGKTPPIVHLEDEEEAMVAYWRETGMLEEGPVIVPFAGDFEGQDQLEAFDEEEIAAEGMDDDAADGSAAEPSAP